MRTFSPHSHPNDTQWNDKGDHLPLRLSSCSFDFISKLMVLRKRTSKQSLRGTTWKRLQQPRQSRNRKRLWRISGIIYALKLFFFCISAPLSKAQMIFTMEKTPQSDTLFCLGELKQICLYSSGRLRLSFLSIFSAQSLQASVQVASESQTTSSQVGLQTAMTSQWTLGMLTRKMRRSQARQLSGSRWLLMKMSVSECVKRQVRRLLSLWQLLAPSTCRRYSITAEVIELSSHSPSRSRFRMSCVTSPAYSASKDSTRRSSRSRQWSHSLMQRQHSVILPQQKELSLQGRFRSTRRSSSSSELSFWKISLLLRSKVAICRSRVSRVGRARQLSSRQNSPACWSLLSCLKSRTLCFSLRALVSTLSNALALPNRGRISSKLCQITANLSAMMDSVLSQLWASLSLLSRSYCLRLTERLFSMKSTLLFLLAFMRLLLLESCLRMSSLRARKERCGYFRTATASSFCLSSASPSSSSGHSEALLRSSSSRRPSSSPSSIRTPETYSTSGIRLLSGFSKTSENSLGSTTRGFCLVLFGACFAYRLKPCSLGIILLWQNSCAYILFILI